MLSLEGASCRYAIAANAFLPTARVSRKIRSAKPRWSEPSPVCASRSMEPCSLLSRPDLPLVATRPYVPFSQFFMTVRDELVEASNMDAGATRFSGRTYSSAAPPHTMLVTRPIMFVSA